MTGRCPRCGRGHSGVVCGIPSIGVRIGIGGVGIGGTRVGGLGTGGAAPKQVTKQRASPKEAALKSKAKRHLEGMLAWSEGERQKVLEMLKVIPPEMGEYMQLVERLEKLEQVLKQARLQLG